MKKLSVVPVVYALLNDKEEIFYVGLSSNLMIRMIHHRARFGQVSSKVLQTEFINETPHEAEARWIKKLLSEGYELKNSSHTGTPLRKKQAYGAVNVAKAPLQVWADFIGLGRELGICTWLTLEEALTDWLEKAGQAEYVKPDPVELRARREGWTLPEEM